jgi:hypothetical protein
MKNNHVGLGQFLAEICNDHNIDIMKKVINKYNDYPIVNNRRIIHASYSSVIVDRKGQEWPYMLTQSARNNDKLFEFDHIYTMYGKNLDEILKEINLTLKSEPCRICEGGGWYSQGTRWFYKDIYCEI